MNENKPLILLKIYENAKENSRNKSILLEIPYLMPIDDF